MALKTKQEVVDEIVYEVYIGPRPNNAIISDAFVCRLLNNKIAEAAVKSAFGSYNLDGTVTPDGIFRLTYTSLSLSTDAITFVKYCPLPTQPVGLPSNRSFEIFPTANRGGVQSNLFKMIDRSQVSKVRSLPSIRKVFCYVDNGNMNFVDSAGILTSYSSINMSVVSSGANDLTAMLNLPDDMITEVKMAIVPELRQMLGVADNVPLPPADMVQPRGKV